MRWPGVIKPGTVISEFASHEHMGTTIVAAAGERDDARREGRLLRLALR